VFSATETSGSSKTIRIGKTVIPLAGGQVRNLRKGRAFWQILEDAGVPATVFKMPSNYPPVESRQRTLAGMNTPDLKGSYGMFSYFTNEATTISQEAGGGGHSYDVFVIGNRVEAELKGPVNTFRTDAPESSSFESSSTPSAAAKIVVKARSSSAPGRVELGSASASASFTQSVHGICLFYLKEVRPKFKLYVSPIHMDPARPALPLSTPESYARELERRFGPFFTKGLPADTSALENGVLDEEEFLHLDDLVYEESVAMLEYELGRFEEGLLFYYFSNADQRQHMFWRWSIRATRTTSSWPPGSVTSSPDLRDGQGLDLALRVPTGTRSSWSCPTTASTLSAGGSTPQHLAPSERPLPCRGRGRGRVFVLRQHRLVEDPGYGMG
jgi:hypothetical protein